MSFKKLSCVLIGTESLLVQCAEILLQRGHEIKTIISLVPSWTEFVCDIGAIDKLIAKTTYCVEPDEIRNLLTIGGTKNPDIRKKQVCQGHPSAGPGKPVL